MFKLMCLSVVIMVCGCSKSKLPDENSTKFIQSKVISFTNSEAQFEGIDGNNYVVSEIDYPPLKNSGLYIGLNVILACNKYKCTLD